MACARMTPFAALFILHFTLEDGHILPLCAYFRGVGNILVVYKLDL